jgi:hypothetical protein
MLQGTSSLPIVNGYTVCSKKQKQLLLKHVGQVSILFAILQS